MNPIDFVVLTGFLGSGKTTLLREFLALPQAEGTAVIVNEAGEIGLDGALLREGTAGLNISMLANGCICCQLGNDLAETIYALLDAAPLSRIVLETSGLSKPGPILRQLASVQGVPMRVSVLATFDALRGAAVTHFAEAAAQWAAANRIVATRMDAIPPGQHAQVPTAVAALNPLAQIVATSHRAAAVTSAFAPLPPQSPMPPPPDLQTHPQIAIRLARPTAPPTYDALATWLDNLAGALGDRLLRLKGLVRTSEGGPPLLIQSVGTLFSVPRPFPQTETPCFLVLIARDIHDDELAVIPPQALFQISRPATPNPFTRPQKKLPLPLGEGRGEGAAVVDKASATPL